MTDDAPEWDFVPVSESIIRAARFGEIAKRIIETMPARMAVCAEQRALIAERLQRVRRRLDELRSAQK